VRDYALGNQPSVSTPACYQKDAKLPVFNLEGQGA